MGHCFGYTDGTDLVDELSPVSVLRLRFDTLPAETTDIMPESRTVFGLAVPQFVPQRIISWMGQDAEDTDQETTSNGTSTKKVCRTHDSVCVCMAGELSPSLFKTKQKIKGFGVLTAHSTIPLVRYGPRIFLHFVTVLNRQIFCTQQ